MLWLETLGTITAILYLCLIAHRRRVAWFFYIASSLAFLPIFYSAQLYADAALQIFFVCMGICAWRSWRATQGRNIQVHSWPTPRLIRIALGITVASTALGYALFSWTNAGWFAYPDAFILVASVVATFLTVWRVVENWWFWLAVNSTTLVVYTLKSIWITSGLALLYTILTVYGLYRWRRARMS